MSGTLEKVDMGMMLDKVKSQDAMMLDGDAVSSGGSGRGSPMMSHFDDYC
jgi:hypothetical protein